MAKDTNINGFTVIASRPTKDGVVIIGHRSCGYAGSHFGHEYVVARVESLSSREWGQGYYSTRLDSARSKFSELTGDMKV